MKVIDLIQIILRLVSINAFIEIVADYLFMVIIVLGTSSCVHSEVNSFYQL